MITIVEFALAILLAGTGAAWKLRGLITSEIEDTTTATNTRLKRAVADIRQEIQVGRESSDRQMSEIRDNPRNTPRRTEAAARRTHEEKPQ